MFFLAPISSSFIALFALTGAFIAVSGPFFTALERHANIYDYLSSDNFLLRFLGKLNASLFNLLFALVKADKFLLLLCFGKLLCVILLSLKN